MPDARNCRRCGKLYNYIGGPPICPDCKRMDEEDFKRIKQYLYDNTGATVSQISAELDISVEKIKRFLKEGRLEIIGDEANMILECESCGKSIKTGRFCDACERTLSNDLKSTAGELSNFLSDAEAKKANQGLKYLHKEDPLTKPKK